MTTGRVTTVAAVAVGLALLLAGCSEDKTATYEERMAHLRKVAARGAETHGLLVSQEATIDRKRCEAAYEGLSDNDIPADTPNGVAVTDEWRDQVKAFFVDSCVSGKPRPVPADATAPPASSTTDTSASTSRPAPAPDPTPTS